MSTFNDRLFHSVADGMFDEAKIVNGAYEVTSIYGHTTRFYSAEAANEVFPGAFDRHPDYDQD